MYTWTLYFSPKEPPPPEKPWNEVESDVMHLEDSTFKQSMKKKKHALVMFYAPCVFYYILVIRQNNNKYNKVFSCISRFIFSSSSTWFQFIYLGCGHCKKAKPEYQNAASQFVDDKKVYISLLISTRSRLIFSYSCYNAIKKLENLNVL